MEYFFRILNGILRIDMQREKTKGQQDKITFNNGYLDPDSHTPNLERLSHSHLKRKLLILNDCEFSKHDLTLCLTLAILIRIFL